MKKLLIVVDYQVDFVSGALGFAGAEGLEEKIIDRSDEGEPDVEEPTETPVDPYNA